MIAAAVLDTDSKDLAYIREVLTAYSIQRNKSLQVYWYTSPNSFDRLEQMIGSVCVALIAVKSGEGRTLGRRVYARNPDCRILFYGPEEQPLRPLLRARPIEYHSFSEGDAAFWRKLDDIFQEIEDAEGVFQFKSRRKNLFLPTRGIMYFQSDLKLVQIHQENGRTEIITAKLSQIEEQLNGTFIRVHQSFLVNRTHIRALDCSERAVCLSNGEAIPISDAKYEATLAQVGSILKSAGTE